MGDRWDWRLTDRARRQFDDLGDYAWERVVSKLDEIVDDPWREPTDHLEPLQGAPHQKLRVGPFRLACRLDRDTRSLRSHHPEVRQRRVPNRRVYPSRAARTRVRA